ncbi:MAG: hypothetical protein ACLFRD_05215 [Nitriliruptoraceae bacterium]
MSQTRWTDQELLTALDDPAVTSLAELCRQLGLVPRGANYATLRTAAARLGIDLAERLPPRGGTTGARRGRRSYDDAQLLAALDDPEVDGYPALCHALGLRPNTTTYRRLREHAVQLGTAVPASWSKRGSRPGARPRPPSQPHRIYPRVALTEALQDARCLADIIRRLGDEPDTRAYDKLARSLREYGLDGPSMHPAAAGAARRTTPLDELLVRGRHRNSSRLRARLLREGLLRPVCATCGGTRWLGEPMPLELDHIDGDRTNNLLSNLRLLCPNCHAQTPTYRGRNIGRRQPPPTDA